MVASKLPRHPKWDVRFPLEENLVLEMRTIQYEGRHPSVMMHDVDNGVVGPGNLSCGSYRVAFMGLLHLTAGQPGADPP